MSKTINVRVRDKIATADAAAYYVCGNSDYIIAFDFDSEWDEYEVKTARFVYNGEPVDVVFTGDSVEVPIIENTYSFTVGVYAGNLHTTTPAYVPSKKSILCGGGTPKPPKEDVYAKITELCNEAVSEANSVRNDADNGAFNGAPGKTPVVGEDYFTEADKQAIAVEAAEAVGFPQPTSSDNGKIIGCEDGKAAWLPVEMSGGGGGTEDTLRLVVNTTTEEDVSLIEITEDMDGNPLKLKKFIFCVEIPAATKSSAAFLGSSIYRWYGGKDTAHYGSYAAKSLSIETRIVKWWGEFIQSVESGGDDAILYARASKTPHPDNTNSSDGGTYQRYSVRKYPYSSGNGIYYFHESIDRVFFMSSGTTVMIPAGTKIKVWGVDA